jgi:arsenate reductase
VTFWTPAPEPKRHCRATHLLMKRRVLILCTGNSCRSQMAEGFWRHLGGEGWDVFSAGLAPRGPNPLAVKAMAELGIDISNQQSRSLDQFRYEPFDLVVTVCSNAERNCPHFPHAAGREHWPFDDPAKVTGDEDERMVVFRRVRDGIAAAVERRLAADA